MPKTVGQKIESVIWAIITTQSQINTPTKLFTKEEVTAWLSRELDITIGELIGRGWAEAQPRRPPTN